MNLGPLWRIRPPCRLSLPSPPDLPAGLSPARCRRPWWPATGWRGVWHLVAVGFFLLFISQANKQAAAGSRSNSVYLLFFLSLSHGCGMGRWRLIRAESYAGTPWPSPWQGIASAAFAPTALPFLFSNKAATTAKVSLYDVDLGIVSLHSAAKSPGVPQQGTCDGTRRLASASYGRRAALHSHALALLQPPVRRPLPEILAGVQHRPVPKWFVPGGVAVAGGGVPDPVERTKDFFAFLVFVLGSYLHCPRTWLCFLISVRVLCVNCIPKRVQSYYCCQGSQVM